MSRRSRRRTVLAGALGLFAAALVRAPVAGADDDVAVPIALQMELLLKVAGYDKNLPARAGNRVLVAIVTKGDDPRSVGAAQQAERGLAGKSSADLPVDATIVEYTSANALARLIKAQRVAIVYAAPGFTTAEMGAIDKALDGADVLSAGAVAKFVLNGVVLGFDLVGSKPKLLFHLGRARRQHVNVSSGVLHLMKVYE